MADLVAPGSSYKSRLALGSANTGLVGTVRFRLLDNDGVADDPVYGPSTATIIEDPTGSGSYLFIGTAPATAGTYSRAWDQGAETDLIYDDDLVVSYSSGATGSPSGRDLCTLADVTQLVPGYVSDTDTDALLAALITAESRVAHELAGREFVTIASATTRQYDLDDWNARKRQVRVGDMTTVTTVTVKDQTGSTLETVTSGNRVSLPRNRQEWEPITTIWFPTGATTPAGISSGSVLEVVGVWGFPSLPADLVQATAKMVLVRYLADAASAGTALADALNDQGFNAGQAFASARDVIYSYRRPTFV